MECSVEGCDKLKGYSSGLCPMHYQRIQHHGSLDLPVRPTAKERFLKKVAVMDFGCWLWCGGLTDNGYASFSHDNPSKYGYIFSYLTFVGPITSELELDHLCRMRRCVNPEHLEAVPHQVNSLRGESPSALLAGRTHCANGHEFTEENTHYRKRNNGTLARVCRACRNLQSSKRIYTRAQKDRRNELQNNRRAAERAARNDIQ